MTAGSKNEESKKTSNQIHFHIAIEYGFCTLFVVNHDSNTFKKVAY